MRYLAAVQQVKVVNWPTPAPGPTPDDRLLSVAVHLNQITTVGIIVSAVVGAFIALTFFSQLQDYKLKRAMRLVDDWYKSVADLPSPFECLRIGFGPSDLPAANRGVDSHIQTQVENAQDRYAVVDGYFQLAWHLYKRRMVDRQYFLYRMTRIILHASDNMKQVRPLFGNSIPEKVAVDQLRPIAYKYGIKNGWVRESNKERQR